MKRTLYFVFPLLLTGAAPKAKETYMVRVTSATAKHRQAVMDLSQSKDGSSGDKLVEALADKDAMSRGLALEGLA